MNRIQEILELQKKRKAHPLTLVEGRPVRSGDPLTDALTEVEPISPFATPAAGEPAPSPAAPEEVNLEAPDRGEEEIPDSKDMAPGELQMPTQDDATEQKRIALFNTVSESIDAGEVERTEQAVRDYIDTHQAELGDLAEVEDAVIDMMIQDSVIYRSPYDKDKEEKENEEDERPETHVATAGEQGSPAPQQGTTQPYSVTASVDKALQGGDLNAIIEDAAQVDEKEVEESLRAVLNNMVKFNVVSKEQEAIEEMWKSKLRQQYSSFDEWKDYSDTYGLAKRLGFNSAEEAWKANPTVQGSTDPKDFKIVKEQRGFRKKGELTEAGEMGEISPEGEDDAGNVWSTHAAIARALGGELHPFDQYQGPYINVKGYTLWLTTEDGVTGRVYNETAKMYSDPFNIEDLASATEAAQQVIFPEEQPPSDTVESVKEQVSVVGAKTSVSLSFESKEERDMAKGALMQYEGVEEVVDRGSTSIVVFTSDETPDMANKRVMSILYKARLGESVVKELDIGGAAQRAVGAVGRAAGTQLRGGGFAADYWVVAYDGTNYIAKQFKGDQEAAQAYQAQLQQEWQPKILDVRGLGWTGGEPGAEGAAIDAYRREVQQRELTTGARIGEGFDLVFDAGFKTIYERYDGPNTMELPIRTAGGMSGAGTSDVGTSSASAGGGTDVSVNADSSPEEVGVDVPSPPIWRFDAPLEEAAGKRLEEILNKLKEEEVLDGWIKIVPEEDGGESPYYVLEYAPRTETEARRSFPETIVAMTLEEGKEALAINIAGYRPVDEEAEVPAEIKAEREDEDYDLVYEADGWEGKKKKVAGREVEEPTHLKSLAKSAGVSLDKALTAWGKAQKAAEKQYPDVGKKSDRYYSIVTGIAKKMMGVKDDVEEASSIGILLNTIAWASKKAKGFQSIPGAVYARALINLEQRGLVRREKIGWFITDKGKEFLARETKEMAEGFETIFEIGGFGQRFMYQPEEAPGEVRHAQKHAWGKAGGYQATKKAAKQAFAQAARGEPGAELPEDLQALVDEYKAALASGDNQTARELRGEIEFEAGIQGLDLAGILGESEEKKEDVITEQIERFSTPIIRVPDLEGNPREVTVRGSVEPGDPSVGVRGPLYTAEAVYDADGIEELTEQFDMDTVEEIVANFYGKYPTERDEEVEKEAYPTPGMKIRSQGQGRGVGTGQGEGPVGVPGEKICPYCKATHIEGGICQHCRRKVERAAGDHIEDDFIPTTF